MARLVQRDDMNDIPSDSGIEPGAASGDTASSVDAARDGVKSRRIADDITNTVAPQLIDQLSDVLPKLTEEQDKQKKNDSIGSKLMKAKMAAAIISHIPAILGCLCAVAGLGSMVSCAMGFGSGEEETVTTGVSTMMIGDDTAYSYPGSSSEDGDAGDSGGNWGENGQPSSAANDVQKKLIEAANSTGWPGASLCATWTSRVFRAAFGVSFNGDGGDQYRMIQNKSQDKSDLEIGMIVACAATPTKAGRKYGHTAIYIGDGMVMESLNSGVAITPIDDWIRIYPSKSRAPNSYGWGWLPGFDLSTNQEPTQDLVIDCGCPNE